MCLELLLYISANVVSVLFLDFNTETAKGDDWVLIDFEGKIDGTVFEGGKASRYPVLLGSQSLLKDFEENLIGLKAGDSKTFKITFPTTFL